MRTISYLFKRARHGSSFHIIAARCACVPDVHSNLILRTLSLLSRPSCLPRENFQVNISDNEEYCRGFHVQVLHRGLEAITTNQQCSSGHVRLRRTSEQWLDFGTC